MGHSFSASAERLRKGANLGESELPRYWFPCSGRADFLVYGRSDHTATEMEDGRVLVAGGMGMKVFHPVPARLESCAIYVPEQARYEPAEPLKCARSDHTATKLRDGGILATGGIDEKGRPIQDCEVFGRLGEVWAVTGGLNQARHSHATSNLYGNRALTVGGIGVSGNVLSSVELFEASGNDFTQGAWQEVQPLCDGRAFHTALLLEDGTVLVAGGFDKDGEALASCQVYSEEGWESVGSLSVPRFSHRAARLLDGRVIVTGGIDRSGLPVATAEIYDPLRRRWSKTQAPKTARCLHTATVLRDGRLLVAGGSDGSRITASWEIFDSQLERWTLSGELLFATQLHTATLLDNDSVLLVGGSGETPHSTSDFQFTTQIFHPDEALWIPCGPLTTAREGHRLTAFADGSALATGGRDSNGVPLSTTEWFHPQEDRFRESSPLGEARTEHTATSLSRGRVVVCGGIGKSGKTLASVEIFSPAKRDWAPIEPGLLEPRRKQEATLLYDGWILVTGGRSASGNCLDTVELLHPEDHTTSEAPPISTPRSEHRATLALDGRVVVSGGVDSTGKPLKQTELFLPQEREWCRVGDLREARSDHCAVLLNDGRILVMGGLGETGGALSSCELFDPSQKTWRRTDSLRQGRAHFTAFRASSGRVVVAGGGDTQPLASVEEYDPIRDRWRCLSPLGMPRQGYSGGVLADGRMLVSGGVSSREEVLCETEIAVLPSGKWTPAGKLGVPRAGHRATLLDDGQLLISGGHRPEDWNLAAHPTEPLTSELFRSKGSSSWRNVPPTYRHSHTATLLLDGSVLAVGGWGSEGYLSSVESFEHAQEAWRPGSELSEPRAFHTATRLRDGSLLVAGGRQDDGPQGLAVTTEVMDPSLNRWRSFPGLQDPRQDHQATLLEDGSVLVTGGTTQVTPAMVEAAWVAMRASQTDSMESSSRALDSTEIWNPKSRRWVRVSPMPRCRFGHTATLLSNGRVLVAGGLPTSCSAPTTQVYDPRADRWIEVGPLHTSRTFHTATLLPDGRVLVTGGLAAGRMRGSPAAGKTVTADAEVYSPKTGTWVPAAPLRQPRFIHTATLLSSGQVLVVGGFNMNEYPAETELYDPG